MYHIKLATDIIKELYGENLEKVCLVLLQRGRQTLQELLKHTSIPYTQLRNSLLVLLQQNIVSALVDDETLVSKQAEVPYGSTFYYDISVENVLHRMRFPKFSMLCKEKFGDRGEAIVDELLEHGRLSIDQIIRNSYATVSELIVHGALEPAEGDEQEALKETVMGMVRAHLLERVPPLGLPTSVVPVASSAPTYAATAAYLNNRFMLPTALVAPPPPPPVPAPPKVDGAIPSTAAKTAAAAAASKSKKRKGARMIILDDDEVKAADAENELPLELRILVDGSAPPPPDPTPSAAKKARKDSGPGAATTTGSGAAATSADKGAPSIPEGDILWRVNYDQFVRQFRHQACLKLVVDKFNPTAGAIMRAALSITSTFEKTPRDPVSSVFYLEQLGGSLPPDVHLPVEQLRSYLELLHKDKSEFLCKSGDLRGGAYVINLKRMVELLRTRAVETVVRERFGVVPCRIFRLLISKKQLEEKQVGELAMCPIKDTREHLHALLAASYVNLQEIPRGQDHNPQRTFYFWSVDLKRVCGRMTDQLYRSCYNVRKRLAHEVKTRQRLLASANPASATPEETQQLETLQRICDRLESAFVHLDDTLALFALY